MLNEASIQAVDASRLNDHFRKPLYDSYCFSNIPNLVFDLLTGQKTSAMPLDVLGDLPQSCDNVILLYVDAFGWRFFERYAEKYPFLKRIIEQGVVSKITSQFPSTTAAHMGTVHTGTPVGEHGIYEWFYYEPLLDRMISPLIFSYAGDEESGTLKLPPRVKLHHLFGQMPIYTRLKHAGVNSYVFQSAEFTPSPFSYAVFSDAKVIPFKSFSQGLVDLASAVTKASGKSYFYYYFETIDTLGHRFGVNSKQFDAEVDTFFTALERLLQPELTPNTLLLITADHGQVEVSPKTTVYLNQAAPTLRNFIRRNDEGGLLVPAGSARDIFLHIEPQFLDEAFALLTDLPQLQGKAEVYRTADLIAQGYFGGASEHFLNRIADLVVLPYAGESVWWYQAGRFEQPFWGHHGGLTPQELHIPLLAMAY